MDVLSTQHAFSSLSLRDLLEARDQYHVHLLNKQNVVGTAVGLYLIRNSDPWPSNATPAENLRRKSDEPRTLANSRTRPYSWPCVLVFVREWIDTKDLAKMLPNAQDVVPKSLYLPDGRVVPVCVVKLEQQTPGPVALPAWSWPKSRIGAGFPLVVRSQGEERTASVGCLVSDGHTLYALTSRHACGPAGTEVSSLLRGTSCIVGDSSPLQLTQKELADVYPAFPGRRTILNQDVGLVAVRDARDWTSQVFGLGPMGAVADLNEYNIGVQLIDQPVKAFGAASGRLEGRIKALFYRYRSIGGYDYVSDMLIAPTGESQTLPGDSGTVWHLELEIKNQGEAKKELRPIAVEWGAQTVGFEGKKFNFALATNLSPVLKLLGVELVVTNDLGARPYWGATGHYSIAHLAVTQVTEPKLKKLMSANSARISYDRAQLETGKIGETLKNAAFVPLADVPDIVWKKTSAQMKGGRDPHPRGGPEHPTHYADIDMPGADDGASLRKLCTQDPANVAVDVWQQFYDSVDQKASSKRGLLPFRVWQFFDAMVGYAKAKDYARFVAAAGTLAHYVGDSCQVLHGSILADGFSDQAVEGVTSGGKKKLDWPAKGVHSAYETKMIDEKAPELFALIDKALQKKQPKLAAIADGHGAAVAVVELMDKVAKIIPPKVLCDRYIELGEGASKAVIDGLWETFDTKTAQCMTLGIRLLAALWNSAWVAGGGAHAAQASIKQFTESKLRGIYENTQFVPSLDLDAIGAVLKN